MSEFDMLEHIVSLEDICLTALSSLSVRQARIEQAIKDMQQSAQGRPQRSQGRIVDRCVHKILNESERLAMPGGWYVIENIPDDINERFPDTPSYTFQECMASVQRWCNERSKWYSRERYRIVPVAGWVTVYHDRFWFYPAHSK